MVGIQHVRTRVSGAAALRVRQSHTSDRVTVAPLPRLKLPSVRTPALRKPHHHVQHHVKPLRYSGLSGKATDRGKDTARGTVTTAEKNKLGAKGTPLQRVLVHGIATTPAHGTQICSAFKLPRRHNRFETTAPYTSHTNRDAASRKIASSMPSANSITGPRVHRSKMARAI